MLKLVKYVISFFLSIIILLCMTSNIYATSVNANNTDTNVINSRSTNSHSNTQNTETSTTSGLDTNPEANVQSLERNDYSSSSFDFTNIINILLIAVGIVIILLAIAILIRLKK